MAVPFDTIMLDTDHYLVDCYLKAKCVALNQHPFFIAAIRQKERRSECILFNSRGIVESNSYQFSTMIGYSDDPIMLNGVHMSKLI